MGLNWKGHISSFGNRAETAGYIYSLEVIVGKGSSCFLNFTLSMHRRVMSKQLKPVVKVYNNLRRTVEAADQR